MIDTNDGDRKTTALEMGTKSIKKTTSYQRKSEGYEVAETRSFKQYKR